MKFVFGWRTLRWGIGVDSPLSFGITRCTSRSIPLKESAAENLASGRNCEDRESVAIVVGQRLCQPSGHPSRLVTTCNNSLDLGPWMFLYPRLPNKTRIDAFSAMRRMLEKDQGTQCEEAARPCLAADLPRMEL
jgi:hypothetical protein